MHSVPDAELVAAEWERAGTITGVTPPSGGKRTIARESSPQNKPTFRKGTPVARPVRKAMGLE